MFIGSGMLEIYTDEPLLPDPNPFEVENAVAKLKSINLQVVIRFKQEVKHNGLRSINSLILFGLRTNCLILGKNLLLYHFPRRAIKLAILIVGYHCYQLYA
jgi:hypothetical protein